jgi:adenosylhomocysteinase
VVGDGKVVNLTAGEGHPVEIMDLTFSVQALSARHLLLNADKMEPKVHVLPPEIDQEIARNKLDALGLRIDRLTPAQEEFLRSWEVPA